MRLYRLTKNLRAAVVALLLACCACSTASSTADGGDVPDRPMRFDTGAERDSEPMDREAQDEGSLSDAGANWVIVDAPARVDTRCSDVCAARGAECVDDMMFMRGTIARYGPTCGILRGCSETVPATLDCDEGVQALTSIRCRCSG
jgi:hypothetical protein